VKCFVDTSAFYALEDPDDHNHGAAVGIQGGMAAGKPELYTTNHVLDECVTLIGSRMGAQRAIRFARDVLSSRLMRIVRSDEQLEESALALYERFSDARLSFTDCLSFAAMRAAGIRIAFSFDRHFERAGFGLARPDGTGK
jgi:predicted nucleic acid-binding protein